MTCLNQLQALRSTLRALQDERNEFVTEIRTKREREFEQQGGCSHCNGRRVVVVWDTMDSMSGCYAEYGRCPEFDTKPEAHGPEAPFNHAVFTKYDQNRGVRPELFQTEEEKARKTAIETAISEVTEEIKRAEFEATPRKGVRVKVVKGRKVPKGIEGEVFWAGKDAYSDGLRVGFKTKDGEKFFTAGSNVEVVA